MINDRRNYPRFPGGTHFAGQRIDGNVEGNSIGQGPGGAYLESTNPIRASSTLILTLHNPFEHSQPVYLVAQVVRPRLEPPFAIGIQWRKAVCHYGFKRLKAFPDVHFHRVVDPKKPGAWTREELEGLPAYDFLHGSLESMDESKLKQLDGADLYYRLKMFPQFLPKAQYFEVKLLQSGDNSKHSRPFRRELSMDTAAMLHADRYGVDEISTQLITVDSVASSGMNPGEIAEWKLNMKERKRVRIPADLLFQRHNVNVVVYNLGSNVLLVLAENVNPKKGDRAVLEIPLTVETRSGIVIVIAEVRRVARDRSSRRVGIDLGIISVDEQEQDGLFSQYLLAL